MQLTRFTDYALRTLLYLGAHPGSLVPASTISAAHGISLDHTIKAAKRLTQLGYVQAQRGKGGGLTLARSPSTIHIGAVVRDMEATIDLLECFDAETNTCKLSPACHLKNVMFRARQAFFEVLDGYTLADLLTNGPELIQLLSPGALRRA